jgi:nucleotide-binding universal stress UspA family protein
MAENQLQSNDPDALDIDEVPAGAIVVGLDGSGKDDAVLTFAEGEAVRFAAPLHLVVAHEIHAGLVGAWDAGFVPVGLEVDLAAAGERILAGAEQRVHTAYPQLKVTTSQPWGTPSRALVEASEHARLLVVGSGRKGAVEQALLGTTSLDTAMHAACPVAVVGPRPGVPDGPVVVGLDGSSHSVPAATVAVEEAAARGVRLVVATTWWLEVVDGVVVTEPGTEQWEIVQRGYRKLIDEALAAGRSAHPEVEVEVDIRNARPVPTLIELAESASLLVVGSRGRGGFAGAALGSVSHKVLQRAGCPVIVTRPHRRH